MNIFSNKASYYLTNIMKIILILAPQSPFSSWSKQISSRQTNFFLCQQSYIHVSDGKQWFLTGNNEKLKKVSNPKA